MPLIHDEKPSVDKKAFPAKHIDLVLDKSPTLTYAGEDKDMDIPHKTPVMKKSDAHNTISNVDSHH